MRLLPVLATAAVALASPARAHAAVLYSSDYANGLSSWQAVQQPAGTNRIAVVPTPTGPSSVALPQKVMRAELRGGDLTNTGGYVAPRAEVYGRAPLASMASVSPLNWPDPVGAVRWYGFSVYIPADFAAATDTKWLDLTQWKGLLGGSPPIALEIKRSNFRLGGTRTNAGLIANSDLGPINPGSWTRFVFGMKFSADPSAGWIHVYRDGADLTGQISVATMDIVNGQVDPLYLKQGLYRSAAFTSTQVVDFAPVMIATTREEVATGQTVLSEHVPSPTHSSRPRRGKRSRP